MVKVFKFSSPLAVLTGLAVLLAFVFIGLPVLIVFLSFIVLMSLVRSLFGISKTRSTTEAPESPYVSPVIHNKNIGDYRVIENPNDPSIVEVEKV